MRPEFYKVLMSPILWGILLLAAPLPFLLPTTIHHMETWDEAVAGGV